MAITRYGAQRFSGLEADVNNLPIDADLLGAIFNSTDTLKFFIFNGTTWNESAGGGGITGLEPNSTILEYLNNVPTVFTDYTTPTSATATSPLVTNVTSLKAYYQYNNDPTLGNLINQATAVGSVDSVPDGDGTNTSVSSVTGLIGNAYDYSQSTLAMTVLGSSLSQFNFLTTPNEKWSMAFWLNLPAAQTVVGRYFDSTTTSFNKFGLSMFINTDRSLGFQFSNNSGAYYLSHNSASNFIPASPTDWFFIALTYDATLGSNQFSYSVNNGTPVLVSRASVEIAGNTTDPYTFGQNSVGGGNQPYIGLVDKWSIWNRLLTTQEITDLFNAGSGAVLGNTADEAIDKNTTTFWQSNAGINESITLDMGSVVNAYGLAYFLSTDAGMTETQFQIKAIQSGSANQNLEAYYKFDNDPTTGNLVNQATAVDSVDSNLVDLANTNVVQNVAGLIDNAYQYSSARSVDTGGAGTDWQFLYGLNQTFTMIMWAKQTVATNGSNQVIIDNSTNAGALGIQVQIRGANNSRLVSLRTHDGTTLAINDTSAGSFPSDTNFHMIAIRMTFGGGSNNLSISIDDVEELFTEAQNGVNGTSGSAMAFGATSAGLAPWVGSLDEWSFHSRILTDAEVTNLFNGGSGQAITSSNIITTLRTLNTSELTLDVFNFIRFNGINTQFIQIEGSSGSALVMAANELAVQIESDPPLTTKHGQFTIPTIAGTPLNGGDPTSSVIEDPIINTITYNNVSTPADPALDKGLMWLETLDGTNNIINAKVKKDGVIETFQVVPPLIGPSDPVITAPDGTQGTLKMTNDGRMTIVPL